MKRRIDLRGPDGNAFVLLGLADKWGRQLKKDTDTIQSDMRSGDYENLLNVFEREFGHVCTLVNNPYDNIE